VTANFFHTLGVKPMLGRTFLPDEDGLGGSAAAHSAIVSYRFWEQELGADPNVLGRTVALDSALYTIVGVLPGDFQFWWRRPDIWIPISLDVQDRDYHNLTVIARLNGPRSRAGAEMAVIARRLEQAYPKNNKGWTIQVEDFRERLLNRTFRMRLLLLSGAVGLVLLIASANIAGLLLARSAGRYREIAVRMSVGATRSRIAAQLLTESAILSLAGGALGLALAWVLIRTAPKVVPVNAIPGGQVELSLPVVWFTLAISLLTCLLFGLAPALAASRPDLHAALKDSARGSTAGRSRQRFRQIMVASETAIALVLLASAGLMIEALRSLGQSDLGFDPKNVLTLRLFLPTARYNNPQALRFQRGALLRMAALPGVKNVTVATALPLINTMEAPIDLEGSAPRGNGERPSVAFKAVSSDYFLTFRIPMRRGRAFAESDDENAPPIAIVSEQLAALYFPNQDPVGKRLLVNKPIRGRNGFAETQPLEIVGVAGNVKVSVISSDPQAVVYVPHPQGEWSPAVWFAVRTDGNPTALASALRAVFLGIDKDQPIEQVGTLEQMLSNQFAQPRFQTGLMSAFAMLALLLAAVGIYGVNAYAVTQRRNEIGLRMALGATPGVVVWEIVSRSMGPTAIGIAVGLAGAVGTAFGLRSVLVGAGALDPVAFVEAALLLAAVAALACYLPARKATQIHPAIALRAE
jgi:putative ABC transport system permease protein